MHFDFSAFLVLATFLTAGAWLWDIFFLKPARALANKSLTEDQPGYRREPVWVEYSRSFFPVILLVLILRSFLFEPFKIPSGSMMPTLLVGDFILVNKFSYGVRIPVVEWEVLDLGKPQRGDVAVFRFPKDPSLDYIKRIVGLPGDEIQYINKTLYINGEEIGKIQETDYNGEDAELMRPPIRVHQERIDTHEFNVLEQPQKPSLAEGRLLVPEGSYFAMGDNRDNSNDSRFWGFVPVDNLVGRAEMIWMSWDSGDTRVRWERIGNDIN